MPQLSDEQPRPFMPRKKPPQLARAVEDEVFPHRAQLVLKLVFWCAREPRPSHRASSPPREKEERTTRITSGQLRLARMTPGRRG